MSRNVEIFGGKTEIFFLFGPLAQRLSLSTNSLPGHSIENLLRIILRTKLFPPLDERAEVGCSIREGFLTLLLPKLFEGDDLTEGIILWTPSEEMCWCDGRRFVRIVG